MNVPSTNTPFIEEVPSPVAPPPSPSLTETVAPQGAQEPKGAQEPSKSKDVIEVTQARDVRQTSDASPSSGTTTTTTASEVSQVSFPVPPLSREYNGDLLHIELMLRSLIEQVKSLSLKESDVKERVVKIEKDLATIQVRLESFVTRDMVRTMMRPQSDAMGRVNEELVKRGVQLDVANQNLQRLVESQGVQDKHYETLVSHQQEIGVNLTKFQNQALSEIDILRREGELKRTQDDLARKEKETSDLKAKLERRSFKACFTWLSEQARNLGYVATGLTVLYTVWHYFLSHLPIFSHLAQSIGY